MFVSCVCVCVNIKYGPGFCLFVSILFLLFVTGSYVVQAGLKCLVEAAPDHSACLLHLLSARTVAMYNHTLLHFSYVLKDR